MNLNAINGNPLYHGSPNKFLHFSYDYIGGDKSVDQEGPGFYLTTSYEDAKRYSSPDGGIARVSAKLRRTVPLKGRPKLELIQDLILAAPNLDDTLTNWGETRSEALRAAWTSIVEYNNGPHDAYQIVWVDFYHKHKYGDIQYLKNMIAGGYDGVIIPRSECVHLVAFDPKKLHIIGWDDRL